MTRRGVALDSQSDDLLALTRGWGEQDVVSLYLERCQVDTPDTLVEAAWRHVGKCRKKVGKVVDFGAGDGRFANYGEYDQYIGYEIDKSRCGPVGRRAKIRNACAFVDTIDDADLCIGNPPFVRNQDLPKGWRSGVSDLLRQRTGVQISGLANAWQYFFLLSLASLKPNGFCVLIIPFEWVSRPSARNIRSFIMQNGWNVDVYRLVNETFDSVLTTASITVVDKLGSQGQWRYFEETNTGKYKRLTSPSGSPTGVLDYMRHSMLESRAPRAKRGLSPGTQKVLVLTEGERVANGLTVDVDVVPCVTSLRPLPTDEKVLDAETFARHYREVGQKCWLIQSDNTLSENLVAYLEAVPASCYQTRTCLERNVWWQFTMPDTPNVLIAQTFKHRFPKAVRNGIAAIAVGSVGGVYNLDDEQVADLVSGLGGMDISDRVISYANGLRKVEINQLNWILTRRFKNEMD